MAPCDSFAEPQTMGMPRVRLGSMSADDVGVPDYFIVDVDARIIERWAQGRETPLVLSEELVWQPASAKTPLTVALPELFDRIWEKLHSLGVPRRLV